MAGYLTVFISGVYEDAVENTIMDYVSSGTKSNPLKDYIYNTVRMTFRNPSFKNIKRLLDQFKKEWGEKITLDITMDGMKVSLDIVEDAFQGLIKELQKDYYYIEDKNQRTKLIDQMAVIIDRVNGFVNPKDWLNENLKSFEKQKRFLG